MSQNKEVPVYHVSQRGGKINGICVRTKKVWRVGATSAKEAIQYVQNQVDKTSGYTVTHVSNSETMSRGLVVPGKFLFQDHLTIDKN